MDQAGSSMDDRDRSEPSFDPRSWGRPSVAPAPPPLPSPTPATLEPLGHTPLWGTLAGVTITLLGAAVSFGARDGAPAPSTHGDPPPAAVAVSSAAGLERRTLLVPDAGELGSSLRALGIAADDADAAARLAAARVGAGELRLEATLRSGEGGTQLHNLLVTRTDGSGVAIKRDGDALSASAITAKVERRLRFVRGELDGQSFYSSAVAAGVEDVLVGDFANAFRYDFDMQREVAPGDVFEAGFEQRVAANGAAVGAPVLVYAALTTAAKSRALYRYQPPGGGTAEWFDSAGASSRRALMRTPVEAARISSGFGMRGHPILGFVKMHRGTDFAAPTGTPIVAAGDALVEFAAPKGPNGNFVRLRHDNGWKTLYLHMNRFAPGIAAGMRVTQGQQIGEVGTTGRSTGPHLHYEVHIDGQAVDPLSIDTGVGVQRLNGAALARFRARRDVIDRDRAAGA
jgi:murein DD-endopeptidase MepM/ murein hydrolase activator NlpD